MGLFRRHSGCRCVASCAGRWVVALPLIALGIAISAHEATAVAEPAASTTTAAAPQQHERSPHRAKKSTKAERLHHQLVRHMPPPDDLSDVVARARPAEANAKPPPADAITKPPPADVIAKPPPVFPPLLTEDTLGLEPRSVPTVKFSAAGAIAPPLPDRLQADPSVPAPPAEASPVTVGAGRPDPPVTVINVPAPAQARVGAPLRELAAPALSLTAADWLMLCGAFGLGAIGGYAALRRARDRLNSIAQASDPQSLAAASRNRHADRVARQRLFPHQFGTAIRG